MPVLVLHRTHDRVVSLDQAKDMASRIPGAVFVELPGADHFPWFGDQDAVVREIERFLASARVEQSELDRALATVLFTDIVGSTEKVVDSATDLGGILSSATMLWFVACLFGIGVSR